MRYPETLNVSVPELYMEGGGNPKKLGVYFYRAYDYGNMDRFECHYFQQLA
jgi:hypothetical protein